MSTQKPDTPNAEPKRLLAINFGGIGDEILFLPTLATIKKYFPSWHVSLLLEPRSASVSQITNLVDEVICFDVKKRPLMVSDLIDLTMLIRNGNFDIALSSGASPLVSALLFLSGIPTRIGYNTNIFAGLLLTNPVALNKNQYAAGMYHDLTKGLGIKDDFRNPKICLPESSRTAMQNLVGSSKTAKRVIIHPGTSKLAVIKRIFKTWPSRDWAQLIHLLLENKNIAVVLAGGPDDEETIHDILQALKDKGITTQTANFTLAYGKTKSLADLGALIATADLLVCVDSAPMHVAVGLNKKTVALFAATDPERLLPKDNQFTALVSPTNCPSSSHAHPETPFPAKNPNPCPPGVVLPPEYVLQNVLDQLSLSSNQARSPEHCG